MADAPGAVLVTGASTGIGRACVLELDRLGHRVFAGVRREADAQALREAASERLEPLLLDVTDAAQRDAAAKTVDAAVGEAGLAGLVNNAGVLRAGPMECVELDEMRWVLEVNLMGPVALTQTLLPLLRRARGRVVNVTSMGGRFVNPLAGPYCASKFALEAVTDALRQELHPWGMHVSAVEPGAIKTPIFDKAATESRAMFERLPERARSLYREQVDAIEAAGEKLGAAGAPPEKVVRAVVHALTASRPRTRYVVGTDARIQLALKALLPARAVDALLARLLRFPRRAR